MIRFHAPSVSGVYGLYNFRHQILIGNSANIQNALLRHLGETHFRFRRFVPTGFVFELSPADLRESRTQELIREYDPILQAGRPFAALWHSWTMPNAMAFCPQVAAAKPLASDEAKKNATNIETKQLKRFGRERFAIVAAGFAAILLVIGLMTLPAYLKNEPSVAWQIASIGKILTSDPMGKTQVASLTTPQTPFSPERLSEETEVFESKKEPVAPRQAGIAYEQPKPEIFVASELTTHDSISPENKMSLHATKQKASQKSQSARKEEVQNVWAVQAMATTDKGFATDWMEKLKAKGYNAFVIQAELRGQTWYRVRAGNFHTRGEAESLRATLQSEEGFRDAFVAASTKSENLIALNPK
jgi:cell division septation protein DedD